MEYLVQNPYFKRVLKICDAILVKIIRKKTTSATPPNKILLVNPAHLGDVVITTSLLRPLKKHYPDIKIGILVATSSYCVIKDHPLIDYVHFVDHVKLNRSSISLFKKWLFFRKSQKKALKEIKKIGYDTAYACRFHYPNLSFFLFKAKIPKRIGFFEAGFSPFLTHVLTLEKRDTLNAAEHFISLLQIPYAKPLKPYLNVREENPSFSSPYVVIHMHAGDMIKHWPEEKWRTLCILLSKEKMLFLFTGKGKVENQLIEKTILGFQNMVNLADSLSWQKYVSLIKNAHALLSVDTAAGHIAAAFDVPAVHLYTGINPKGLWTPLSNPKVLTHPMSCSPCYKGCEDMTCIKQIDVMAVYAALKEKISTASTNKEKLT